MRLPRRSLPRIRRSLASVARPSPRYASPLSPASLPRRIARPPPSLARLSFPALPGRPCSTFPCSYLAPPSRARPAAAAHPGRPLLPRLLLPGADLAAPSSPALPSSPVLPRSPLILTRRIGELRRPAHLIPVLIARTRKASLSLSSEGGRRDSISISSFTIQTTFVIQSQY